MILGISGSGRPDGITSETVKAILEASGESYEYISLAGKQLNGCLGCTECAGDSRCKQQDDWNAIGEKMLEAEAIVFGAPHYYGTINALAHACLERTFCFRHREVFSLAGKLGIAVGVDGRPDESVVVDYITRVMRSNQLAVVGSVQVRGYSQCYTCGYGETCAAGNVVANHGFIDSIEEWHLPDRLAEQEEKLLEVHKAGKLLGSILRSKRTEPCG
jgi:multimeric flavodoxin WrbA